MNILKGSDYLKISVNRMPVDEQADGVIASFCTDLSQGYPRYPTVSHTMRIENHDRIHLDVDEPL